MRPEVAQILAEHGIVGKDAETAVAWMRDCLEHGNQGLLSDAMMRAFGQDAIRPALVILRWASEEVTA